MNNYDVIVLGSGVAGLTAALYCAKGNKKVLILENNFLGGTTATLDAIDNYPGFSKISGIELIQNIVKQVYDNGINIEFNDINSIDFDNNTILCNCNTYAYKALIIATGTSSKKLNAPQEEKFKFKGLSYCAVCDGSLYKNKNVVVVTNGLSGNSGIEYLRNITQKLIVLDTTNLYKSDSIKTYKNVTVLSLEGDSKLEHIKFLSDDLEHTIACDGLFVCLGKETNLNLFKDKLNINDNYLVTDEDMKTIIPNVFVAGDIRQKKLRQIVTACSDGAIAATEAIKFINTLK